MLTSYVIKEMQINNNNNYLIFNNIKINKIHYTSIRMAQIQNTANTKCWKKVEQELSFIVGGNAKWYSHFRKLVASYKTKHMFTIEFSSHTPWYLPKGVENVCPHKKLHMNVDSSFMYNCQNLEANKASFSR